MEQMTNQRCPADGRIMRTNGRAVYCPINGCNGYKIGEGLESDDFIAALTASPLKDDRNDYERGVITVSAATEVSTSAWLLNREDAIRVLEGALSADEVCYLDTDAVIASYRLRFPGLKHVPTKILRGILKERQAQPTALSLLIANNGYALVSARQESA